MARSGFFYTYLETMKKEFQKEKKKAKASLLKEKKTHIEKVLSIHTYTNIF